MESLHVIFLFEFILLSSYIPTLQYQNSSLSQLFFRRFNGDSFLFTRNQREKVIRIERRAYRTHLGIEELQLIKESDTTGVYSSM